MHPFWDEFAEIIRFGMSHPFSDEFSKFIRFGMTHLFWDDSSEKRCGPRPDNSAAMNDVSNKHQLKTGLINKTPKILSVGRFSNQIY